MNRTQNSDHFTFDKFENLSICSGARPQNFLVQAMPLPHHTPWWSFFCQKSLFFNLKELGNDNHSTSIVFVSSALSHVHRIFQNFMTKVRYLGNGASYSKSEENKVALKLNFKATLFSKVFTQDPLFTRYRTFVDILESSRNHIQASHNILVTKPLLCKDDFLQISQAYPSSYIF